MAACKTQPVVDHYDLQSLPRVDPNSALYTSGCGNHYSQEGKIDVIQIQAYGDLQRPAVPKVNLALAVLYPKEMRLKGFSGDASFRFTIDSIGKVKTVSILKSTKPEFETAVLSAVKNFAFTPARRGGMAVESVVDYDFVFELY